MKSRILMKPKILMIPSWYPTKDNPLHGSFFREQAEALSEYYEFCILHMDYTNSIKKTIFMRLFKNTIVSLSLSTNEDDSFQHIYAVGYIFFQNKRIYRLLKLFGFNIQNVITKQKEFVNKSIFQYLIKLNYLPDVIYAMTAQINGVDVYNFGKINNIPVVLAEHAPFPVVGSVVSDELREAISKSNRILAVSIDKARQILMQNIMCNPIVIGNMVDENIFSISDCKPEIFTILIVAANNFYKDYNTFLHAISYLKKIATAPFKVKIVGYMPVLGESIWYLGEEKFKKTIEEYDILDICELIPKASREEMPNIYGQSSVFVMTSIQEGMSVSALEASCCGLPVFSTRCGGVEDYINDDYGRLFNIQDWKSISIALNDFLMSEIHFDPYKIRENVVSRYGKYAFCKRLDSIFKAVILENQKTNKL